MPQIVDGQRMIHDILPEHWKRFVSQHSLVGKEIAFPWPGEAELVAVVEILDDSGVEAIPMKTYSHLKRVWTQSRTSA